MQPLIEIFHETLTCFSFRDQIDIRMMNRRVENECRFSEGNFLSKLLSQHRIEDHSVPILCNIQIRLFQLQRFESLLKPLRE